MGKLQNNKVRIAELEKSADDLKKYRSTYAAMNADLKKLGHDSKSFSEENTALKAKIQEHEETIGKLTSEVDDLKSELEYATFNKVAITKVIPFLFWLH